MEQSKLIYKWSSLVTILITIIISLVLFLVNKPNAYRVLLNNKDIGYIKNEEIFYEEYNSCKKDLEKRFKNFTINDDIKLKKVKINKNDYTEINHLRKAINDNWRVSVQGVNIVSSGKVIGFCADKNEALQLLNNVKKYHCSKGDGKVKSCTILDKVECVAFKENAVKVKTLDELTQNVIELSKKSSPVFKVQMEYENQKIARKDGAYVSPTRGVVSSSFGVRWGRMHKGIDIAADTGTPVFAAYDGEVVFSQWQDGYGKSIIIKHKDGNETLYGHCSQLKVKKGDKVTKGQNIALVGSTGRSTGPHLHFEVRVNGEAKNPTEVMPDILKQ